MADLKFQDYCDERKISALDTSNEEFNNQAVFLWNDIIERHAKEAIKVLPKLNKLLVGFTESFNFGCSADIWRSQSVISFKAPTPTIMANLLISCFSHPGLMNIQPYRNYVLLSRGGLRLCDGDLTKFLFNDGKLFSSPSSNHDLASRLCACCCDFLFMHELTHIRNGHVDLFKKHVSELEVDVINRNSNLVLNSLDMKTMEWDADKIAHIAACDFGLSRILGKSVNQFQSHQRLEAFRLLHVSLYLLFKLTEHFGSKINSESIHPSPIARMSYILISAENLARRFGIANLPHDFVAEVIVTGQIAWHSIIGDENIPIHDITYEIESKIPEVESIRKNWTVLRKRLLPLNRGITNLSPPLY